MVFELNLNSILFTKININLTLKMLILPVLIITCI